MHNPSTGNNAFITEAQQVDYFNKFTFKDQLYVVEVVNNVSTVKLIDKGQIAKSKAISGIKADTLMEGRNVIFVLDRRSREFATYNPKTGATSQVYSFEYEKGEVPRFKSVGDSFIYYTRDFGGEVKLISSENNAKDFVTNSRFINYYYNGALFDYNIKNDSVYINKLDLKTLKESVIYKSNYSSNVSFYLTDVRNGILYIHNQKAVLINKLIKTINFSEHFFKSYSRTFSKKDNALFLSTDDSIALVSFNNSEVKYYANPTTKYNIYGINSFKGKIRFVSTDGGVNLYESDKNGEIKRLNNKPFPINLESTVYSEGRVYFLCKLPEDDKRNFYLLSFSDDGKGVKFNAFIDHNEDGKLNYRDYEISSINLKGKDGIDYSIFLNTSNYFSPVGKQFDFSAEAPLNWKFSTDSIFSFANLKNDTIINLGVSAIRATGGFELMSSNSRNRCGLKAWTRPKVENVGTRYFSGSITLTLYTALKADSFSLAPTSTNGNELSWEFDSLKPLTFFAPRAYFMVPGTDRMGEMLDFNFTVNVEYDQNNKQVDSLYHLDSIICSYDPNDKSVWPNREWNNNQTLFDETLTYRIRFQNTGSDTAFKVVLLDTISNNLDLTTFKILDYSHPVNTKLNDAGVLTFTFKNILLPYEKINEPESHGFVTYSIKAKEGIAEQTEVLNTAYIYFDLNPPIITNTTKNLMVSEFVGVGPDLQIDYLPILIYPNPSKNTITVELKEIGNAQISINAIDGKRVKSIETKDTISQIVISDLPKGLYILNVNQNGNSYQAKLIKE